MTDERQAKEPVPAWVAERMAKRLKWQAERPAILADGEAALRRLFDLAHSREGDCKVVAAFLLGLYNGYRFPFDLSDFRLMDRELFEDCIAVMRMDQQLEQEVHLYFPDGGAKFEKLATHWDIPDRRRNRGRED